MWCTGSCPTSLEHCVCQALKAPAQAAAVERWADISDPATRAAKMQGLWPIVGEHVGKLRALQDHLSIQQACLLCLSRQGAMMHPYLGPCTTGAVQFMIAATAKPSLTHSQHAGN